MTFVLLVWFCRQLLHYLASFEQHSTGCCPWPVRNSTGIVLCMQHLGAISNVSVLLVSSTELPVSKQEHTKYTRNVMSVNSPWWVFSFFFFSLPFCLLAFFQKLLWPCIYLEIHAPYYLFFSSNFSLLLVLWMPLAQCCGYSYGSAVPPCFSCSGLSSFSAFCSLKRKKRRWVWIHHWEV